MNKNGFIYVVVLCMLPWSAGFSQGKDSVEPRSFDEIKDLRLREIRRHMDVINRNGKRPFDDDYEKPLLGKCKLVRTNLYEVVITFPHRWSKGYVSEIRPKGNIKTFAIHKPYVAGYAETLDGDYDGKKHQGFFIVNSETGEYFDGLTKEKWQAKLNQLNWSNPKLSSPP